MLGWNASAPPLGPLLGLAAGLALVAFLEVLPPLGRFIPGQLIVGALAGIGVYEGWFSAWLGLAVVAGGFAGDLLNYVRGRRHPKRLFQNQGGWWIPGETLDHLKSGLRHTPFTTYVLRRFRTRDRAILPLAAAWEMPLLRFVPVAAAGALVWSVAWLLAGALVGLSARSFHPAVTAALLIGFLLVATRPLETRADG